MSCVRNPKREPLIWRIFLSIDSQKKINRIQESKFRTSNHHWDFPCMKSSTGQYYQSLDHIRALASFLVFLGIYNHTKVGNKIYLDAWAFFFDCEGHTGSQFL